MRIIIELKKYRYAKSIEQNIQAYIIYSNETIDELVNKRPKNVEELLSIKRFGTKKIENYGDDIINIINK